MSVDLETALARFSQKHEALLDRILSQSDSDTNVDQSLRCLAGMDVPPGDVLGSNWVERSAIFERVARFVQENLPDDIEFGVVRIRNDAWRLNSSNASVPLQSMRSAMRVLNGLADASFAAVRFTSHRSKSGDTAEIYGEIRAVIFGRNLRHLAPVIASKRQRKFQVTAPFAQPITFEWPDSFEPEKRVSAIASVLNLTPPRQKRSDHSSKKKTMTVESRTVSRERLMLNSLCPMAKLLAAHGELEPVLSGALSEAQKRVALAYRESSKPLHRDGVSHFWAQLLVREDPPRVPPFVMAR